MRDLKFRGQEACPGSQKQTEKSPSQVSTEYLLCSRHWVQWVVPPWPVPGKSFHSTGADGRSEQL